ncbi:hypothetical protein MASSI9I_51204 [Massilia sp. 9I]|nr:hypothetical protein MASSI9I_51204 [Massilia sp. 9I]
MQIYLRKLIGFKFVANSLSGNPFTFQDLMKYTINTKIT